VSRNRRRVLVAGAGVAGLETALALRALARELVSVELVAPEREFTYRPLAVAEPFRAGEVRRTPLEALVRAAGARLHGGAVTAIDGQRTVAILEGGDELQCDVLVLALGARTSEAVPGALTFGGVEDGAKIVALLDRARSGRLDRIVFALPAAVSWPLPLYELALLTAGYLAEHTTNRVDVLLVTPEVRPLALFGPTASDSMEKLLSQVGVRLETATGRSLAIRSQKKHGAPTAIDLEALITEPGPKRAKAILERADRKVTDTVKKTVAAAATLEDLHAALLPLADQAATPDLLPRER